MTIRERLAKVRDLEYVSVNDLALLTGLSERTVWRRLKANAFPFVLRSGRVTTIHRVSALRVLRRAETLESRNPLSIRHTVPQGATA